MITAELKRQILAHFGFVPTAEQNQALELLTTFLVEGRDRSVMVLRGCAGSGKTALAGAVVHTLTDLRQRVVLLAPTGRAAKVFSVNSGHPAYTIHRRIYREQTFTGTGGKFNLGLNRYQHTLFLVDEASMINRASLRSEEMGFGSGSLLDDLVQFVYSGRHDRLILIGDQAQLPPIGETVSPALNASVLETYGLKVFQCDLKQVLRQGRDSGILANASAIREMINASSGWHEGDVLPLPKIRFGQFPDVVRVSGELFVDSLSDSYSSVGIDETVVITRSNKRAGLYNRGIRAQVFGQEDELSGGDRVMVVRNNYYWMGRNGEADSTDKKGEDSLEFLANGDRAEVERVHNMRELYGFHFADVDLRFPDYGDRTIQATVILESLQTDAPSLSRDQSSQLFEEVMADYADVPLKVDRMKKLREDGYFNALQIKFAYAVTCHKAQGGQWEHVYIDQGYMTEEMLTPDYFHWLYTAITRARGKLFLVNWPKGQTEDETGTVNDEK